MAVKGKKQNFLKDWIIAIQEDNSENQLSVSLVKEILLDSFEERSKKTLKILEKREEKLTPIINDKISSINQRLHKLILDIN